jgi:hypothetical protein
MADEPDLKSFVNTRVLPRTRRLRSMQPQAGSSWLGLNGTDRGCFDIKESSCLSRYKREWRIRVLQF